MSLVLGSIDVSVVPTLGLDLGLSSPEEDKPRSAVAQAAVFPVPCLSGFLKRGGEGSTKLEIGRTFGGGGGESETKPEASSETSSIGVPSDSDEEEEVDSKPSGSLGCLGSLEESLPIKRGLSNHFSGKSKSFANLSGVSVNTMKELGKEEKPLNKRRRLTIAYKLSKKQSLYGWKNPASMPLFPLNEEEDGDNNNQGDQDSSSKDDEEEEEEDYEEEQAYKLLKRKQRLMCFKSCFSLADLQE